MRSHVSFWVGFFVAGLLVVPIAAGIMRSGPEQLLQLATIIFAVVATLVVTLGLVLLCRDWILRKLIGRTEATLEDVAGNLIKAVSAASDGNHSAAAEHAEGVVKGALSWYTWSSFYRWVIATALGLLIAFGAFWGTVLLFEQTRTLRLQTERLEEQITQAVIQNEILTLSLVSELRDQILSTLSQIDAQEALAALSAGFASGYFVYDEERTCSANIAEGQTLTRLPSRGTIMAIAELGQDGELAPLVREALSFLVQDNNDAVALSALIALDQLTTTDDLHTDNLDGLYVEDWDFSGAPQISFSNSVIDGVTCAKCPTVFHRSVVMQSFTLWEGAYVDLSSSVAPDIWYEEVDDRVPGNLVAASTDEDIPDGAFVYTIESDSLHFPTKGFILDETNSTACEALRHFSRENPFLEYSSLVGRSTAE